MVSRRLDISFGPVDRGVLAPDMAATQLRRLSMDLFKFCKVSESAVVESCKA